MGPYLTRGSPSKASLYCLTRPACGGDAVIGPIRRWVGSPPLVACPRREAGILAYFGGIAAPIVEEVVAAGVRGG